MYRRVELIDEFDIIDLDEKEQRHFKGGLCGPTTEEIANAWCGGDGLKGPGRSIPRNSRFYFTELGWIKFGHRVVAACQISGKNYRVIKIKENELNIVFRDENEVAGQPIRKWRKDKVKRLNKKNWYLMIE